MFGQQNHAVRLPTLPRQVVMLVITINTLSFLLLAPPILGEWIKRTMVETVQAAVELSQLTDNDYVAAHKTEREGLALRFSGFDVHKNPDAARQRVWLVETPAPRAPRDDTVRQPRISGAAQAANT